MTRHLFAQVDIHHQDLLPTLANEHMVTFDMNSWENVAGIEFSACFAQGYQRVKLYSEKAPSS
ncbi:hypothetical protein C8R42DRAFT_650453 [Lentinula raphanica]|nr:hypothetical protein C8R42DRAFT_650453 [Lentinula raphanica]